MCDYKDLVHGVWKSSITTLGIQAACARARMSIVCAVFMLHMRSENRCPADCMDNSLQSAFQYRSPVTPLSAHHALVTYPLSPSRILCHVSCATYPTPRILRHVSYATIVSCATYPAPCILPHVSCATYSR